MDNTLATNIYFNHLKAVTHMRLYQDMIRNNNTRSTKELRGKEKRRYYCKYCPKDFSKSYNRNIHERVHTGERPFRCEECEKSFKRADHLRDHMVTHTGQRPHQCPCGRGFSQARALSVHRLLFSSQTELSCPVCRTSFNRRADFKSHLVRHHREIKPKQLQEIVDRFMEDKHLVCSQKEVSEENDIDVCSLDDSRDSLEGPCVIKKKIFTSFTIDYLLS